MNKKCTGIILLLLAIIIFGLYKFYKGDVRQGNDKRIAIQLTIDERNLVLKEMRDFLSSVQNIISASVKNDMLSIADSAKKVGNNARQAVPGALMRKLPLTFKKLGFDTHEKFDALALNALSLGDNEQIISNLAVLMQNCVNCHNLYSLEVVK